MTALVDTNVLVYRCDPGNPVRKRRAEEILRSGARTGNLLLPHQALVEFVAVTTRPRAGGSPLLPLDHALRTVDLLMVDFEVLYPGPEVVRMAFAGAMLHRIPWYDAHLWAYAAANGIPEILSEDFQDGGQYGPVRVVNPFRGL